MSPSKLKTAVILAAGNGTKFWPYNVVRQKAAFPIANVPAVRRLVDDLAALAINQIIVVVGPGEASIRAALRGARATIRFQRQPAALGTADAALFGIQGLDEDFLLLCGDVVTARQNIAELITRFNAEHPLAAALLQPLGHETPQDWLIAHTVGEELHAVVGHDRGGSRRLAGIYALRADAATYLQDNPGVMTHVPVGGMPPVEAEIAQSLQMMIDEGHSVVAVETTGYHVDLDKPWHILDANRQVIRAMSNQIISNRADGNVLPASSQIHDGAEIQGELIVGENCTIGNRVVVKGDLWLGDNVSITNGAILEGPAVIGTDTVVKDYCQIGGYTSIGARGHYGHGAEFSGVALDTVYCYHYMEIWGVVGQGVDFGAATVCGNLRFDDANTAWRIKGRTERPASGNANAAYFGDFCRTGVNAIIMPGRCIGVYSCVGPGVVVAEDVPDRQLVMVKQELETRPWGPERYGW